MTFLWGRSYGEKTFLESEEYKKNLSLKEELNDTRSELEGTKTKLQNIIDQGSNKKTDELLAQILQVFLADLGLQIQNKDLLLQKAKQNTPPPTPAPQITEIEKQKEIDQPEIIEKKQPDWKKQSDSQYKKLEERLVNSKSEKEILKILKELKIKKIESFISLSEEAQAAFYESFTGIFVGAVFDINSKHYGSLSFKANISQQGQVVGVINFSSENHGKSSRTFDDKTFGRMMYGFRSVVIQHNDNKYFQFYRLRTINKIAGNYYEKLPNGTTNLIGMFILNRADQF